MHLQIYRANMVNRAVQQAISLASKPKDEHLDTKKQATDVPTGFHFAEVHRDGKVKFEAAQVVRR